MWEKEENVGYQQFLLLPQYLQELSFSRILQLYCVVEDSPVGEAPIQKSKALWFFPEGHQVTVSGVH